MTTSSNEFSLDEKFNRPHDNLFDSYKYNPRDTLDNLVETLNSGNTFSEQRTTIIDCLRYDDCPSVYMQLSSGLNQLRDVLKLLNSNEQNYILSSTIKGDDSLISRMANLGDKDFILDVFATMSPQTRMDIFLHNKYFILSLITTPHAGEDSKEKTKELTGRFLDIFATMTTAEKDSCIKNQDLSAVWSLKDNPIFREKIMAALRTRRTNSPGTDLSPA